MKSREDIYNSIELFFQGARNAIGDKFLLSLDKASIDPLMPVKDIPLLRLNALFNDLHVTFDRVVEGKVDFSVLGSATFPSRYLEGPCLSSRFAGHYMFDYISSKFGDESGALIRQYFQLSEDSFQDLSQKNNLLLSLDISDYISRYYGPQELIEMGKHSQTHLKRAQVGGLLSSQSSMRNLFEIFFEDIAPLTVERNFRWDIVSFREGELVVSGSPSEELLDSFSPELVVSRPMELLRQGFLEAMPQFFDVSQVECTQIKSMANMDKTDVYRIRYFKQRYS